MGLQGLKALMWAGNGGNKQRPVIFPSCHMRSPSLASRTSGNPTSFEKSFLIGGREERHSRLHVLEHRRKLSLNVRIF